MSSKADTAISKQLSYLLRHDPAIQRDTMGFVHESVLFQHIPTLTADTLYRIVETSSKSRFALQERADGQYVRANQGHSAEVGKQLDDGQTLRLITEPMEGCFHGTYSRFRESIERDGLRRMSRKHIHIAKHHAAKSGQRTDCDVFFYIKMRDAMADGIIFYESENGVILTEGIDGVLPPNYLTLSH